MAEQSLGEYLFERVKSAGVEYSFGIPGDFVLPHFACQLRVGLRMVVMTHEPSVGYAAVAYARARGLGLAVVTYGAGGLNMTNAAALAYAEEVPLLVVSGSPETRLLAQKAQLHHCVKGFDTQFLVYQQLSDACAWLTDPAAAQKQIDKVLDTVCSKSTPGYIEMPRDVVGHKVKTAAGKFSQSSRIKRPASAKVVQVILEKLSAAERPVMFVGAEISRFKLMQPVSMLAERLGLPVVTSILGKGSFPESHPNFLGIYFGRFGNVEVREYVESSDCVLCLGAVLTEMETGGYTAKLEPKNLIYAAGKELAVGHHVYKSNDLRALVAGLADSSVSAVRAKRLPQVGAEYFEEAGPGLTVAGMLGSLSKMLNDEHIIVCDVGDCLYAGLSLKTDYFFAPGYYSSMGFAVPAAIGANLAMPRKRPIVLVGDGGFQMTGVELSTAVKLGLRPIVIVFNNGTYGMLQAFDRYREYYSLASWDYARIAGSLGGDGVKVTTQAEFTRALVTASRSGVPFLIDAVIGPNDISPTLRRLTDCLGKNIGAMMPASS